MTAIVDAMPIPSPWESTEPPTAEAVESQGDRPFWRLSGGVVAHNEERHLEAAVRSLLDQRLPPNARWGTIWIVTSGCTDASAEVARRLEREDPRVRLFDEPERNGKARALREVFRRADGTALVLLNGDAVAAPEAVAALLEVAESTPRTAPVAVMGRPHPVPGLAQERWAGVLELMWTLHHTFHEELERLDASSHLSDELLLLTLPVPCELPEGTVNDGSYLGVWFAEHGAARRYAPRAVVATEAPGSISDHLMQRRRIRYGNVQVRRALGRAPASIVSRALSDPRWGVGFLRRAVRSRPRALRQLFGLTVLETAAYLLAGWDRYVGGRDHVLWARVRRPVAVPVAPSPPASPPPASLSGSSTDATRARVDLLTELASRFGVSLPDEELARLMPPHGPETAERLRGWLAAHPSPATSRHGPGSPSSRTPPDSVNRRRRGVEYLAAASEVWNGPLRRARPWVRLASVSGSTAYGEPEEGDDLDFFVVTRKGTLWWFLLYGFLADRAARRPRAPGARPSLCFNFVIDEDRARREFARDQGLLFAREALTLHNVVGDSYYQGLIASAPWIAEHLPVLYRQRAGTTSGSSRTRASWPSSLLSLSVYPWLATYLQLAGLVRNARLRASGRTEDCFSTQTLPRLLRVRSNRFERLRDLYDPPPGPVGARSVPNPSEPHAG